MPVGTNEMEMRAAAWAVYCNASCLATPVTTAFVAPSSCSQYWTPAYSGQAYVGSGDAGPSIQFTRNFTVSDCVPSQMRRKPGESYCGDCASSSGHPWISPGVCPQGWPTASLGIADGITTGYCCPPEAPTYMLARNSLGSSSSACVGTMGTGLLTFSFNSSWYTSAFSTVPATGTATASLSRYYNLSTVTETRTAVYVYTAQFTASAMVVRYKQGDLTATGAFISRTGQGTSEPTSSNTPASGLSTGAKAGIGVGAAIGVLALMVIGFLIYKRRQKHSVEQAPAQDTWASDHKAELHNEPVQPKEMPAHGYSEVNPQDPAELSAYR